MAIGGTAVPWVAWIPAFTWWWLLFAALAVFALGQGLIWRRRWIDVEKVPFPQTRVAIELIEKATSSDRSLKNRLGLPFVVGLVLGVAFQVPLFLAYLFPWFPDIYGWRTNTCTMGTQYITTDSPLAGIVGFAMFNKDPALGAVFYMAPLNILFGVWFWYLIFAILMQIAFTMGYYTGITGNAGCGRVWCGAVGYRVGDPFKWDAFSSLGVTTGIFISYIILNWRYLAETFNAAIGKLSDDKLDELEKSEPTSYRNAYIIFVGSAALIVVLFMVSGVSFPAALLLIITDLITTLVLTRSYSLIGYLPGGSWFYLGPIKMLLGNGAAVQLENGSAGPTREWFMATSFTYNLVCMPITGGSSPFFASLASYQMANANKVSIKSVFRVQFVTSVLAPIGFVGYVWGMYTFGATKLLWSLGWSSGMGYLTYTPDALRNIPTYEPWWPHMLAGMAFAGLLSFLHARFVWFPLEPIGFLLATDGHSLIEGIWTMALAAWIFKTVTLRVGGSKLYEKTGIPTAIGFIIGLVVISIVGGIVLVVRFFHPF
jgi:hypothetical protein